MNTTINKHALVFGFTSVFLIGLGLTIVNPVIPFMVEQYTKNTQQQATTVTLLSAIYAFSMFLAAPMLGALSDRFGRKIILISSLFGSAIGYYLFGFGGALWILFLGRIIEGLTGGEISAILAYFADLTPIESRTKYFGWISATVGIGTAAGPLIGGFLAQYGPAIPLYVASFLSLSNAVYGYFFMPESLTKRERTRNLSLQQINPFKQLQLVFTFRSVKWLLITGFLIWLPNGSFQAIFAQFSIDTFHLSPIIIGFTFSLIGIMDIFAQLLIMPILLKFWRENQIITMGITSEMIGYSVIILSAFYGSIPCFIIGMVFFGLGDAIFSPSYNGLISTYASKEDQGKIQGASQSIQALARVISPMIGGQLYANFHHTMPFIIGFILLGLATFIVKPKVKRSF
ncbi:tetracycline resistance MFS efflux pump [Enterococcus hirae]|uniref:tetracycline resistance MFS efflux pump n=2 Tax=Enterococcus hirae TaxID=1354 RepID=UPI0005587B7D|nr:tetracycline resistance MFS efflux pump [Enterococcus hirae]OWW64461.1 MFS transporter [Enterococcus hirae 57-09-G6]EMF0044212.1 tetracycline resistance MFS efflux pump [Enterococcus hirae]EMF0054190.1 tetracycline resistance MFS efflux pump [Enterococcus hirae]EMF0057956.1 tetracycline resistance MFS efflux pump [Enterococcus hirae]EMF0071644.1 tetracycline resistance MFS efflux pump [Enterococcus hirae]